MVLIDSLEAVDKIYERLINAVRINAKPFEYSIARVEVFGEYKRTIYPKDIWILNGHKQETITAIVEKNWSLEEIEGQKLPTKIVVTLSNGSETVLKQENDWHSMVENLPNPTGKEQAKKYLCEMLVKGLKKNSETFYVNYVLQDASKEDILIQIIKYALVMADNEEAVEIAPAFRLLKESYLSRIGEGKADHEKPSPSPLSKGEIIELLSDDNESVKDNPLLKNAFIPHMESSNVNLEETLSNILANEDMVRLLVDGFIKCHYEEKLAFDPTQRSSNERINELIDFLKPTGKKNTTPKFPGIRDFLLNRCRLSIISGRNKMVEQSLGGELKGTINHSDPYGLCDDGILLLKHPDDKSFKLISVAKTNASINSECKVALTHLKRWFQDLNYNYKCNGKQLQQLLSNELDRIDAIICSRGNTTVDISVAIEGIDHVITSSRVLGPKMYTTKTEDGVETDLHTIDVGAFSVMDLSGKKVILPLINNVLLTEYSNIVLAGNIKPNDRMKQIIPDNQLDTFIKAKSPVAQLIKK